MLRSVLEACFTVRGAYQLEEKGEAHHERVRWQEILLPPDHEGAGGQVLPAGGCLGYLQF